MKATILTLVFILFPLSAFARGDSGRMGDWSIAGFYGLASVTPADINGLSTAIGSTPPVGSLNSDSYYGGSLSFMMGRRFDLKFAYDAHDAKNYANTNVGSNTGFEVLQNDVWAVLDFYLIRNSSVYAYVGGGAGYPTNIHVTENNGSTTQFDADKMTAYLGEAGLGVMLSTHISLFFEGGYQRIISGNVKDSAGAFLKNTAGNNAVIDLSGMRADAGLRLHF